MEINAKSASLANSTAAGHWTNRNCGSGIKRIFAPNFHRTVPLPVANAMHAAELGKLGGYGVLGGGWGGACC